MRNYDYDYEVAALSEDYYSWRFPNGQTTLIYFQFIDKRKRIFLGANLIDTTKDYLKKEINLVDFSFYLEFKFIGSNAILKFTQIY